MQEPSNNEGNKLDVNGDANGENYGDEELSIFDANDLPIIINLLQKPIKSKRDIRILCHVFMNTKFAKDLNDKLSINLLASLIKRLEYEKFNKGDIIFQAGDEGHKFYIIIQGSVYVLVNNQKNWNNNNNNNEESSDFEDDNVLANYYMNLRTQITNNSTRRDISTSNSKNLKFFTNTSQNPEFIIPSSISNKQFSTRIKARFLDESLSNNTKNTNNDTTIGYFSGLFPKNKKNLNQTDYENTLDNSLIRLTELKKANYRIVKQLNAGETFGEFALFTKTKRHVNVENKSIINFFYKNDKQRTGTVICKEPTHLATLSNDAYENLLKEIHQELYQNKINLFKNIHLFSDWPISKLSSFILLFEAKKYTRNSYIYRKGDITKNIYFIESGEIEIRIHLPIQFENSKNYIKSDEKLELLRISNLEDLKEITIMKASVGTYFGEEEILANKYYREYSVYCTTKEVNILYINKEKFFEHIQFTDTKKKLKEYCIKRKLWIQKRINNMINIKLNNDDKSILNSGNFDYSLHKSPKRNTNAQNQSPLQALLMPTRSRDNSQYSSNELNNNGSLPFVNLNYTNESKNSFLYENMTSPNQIMTDRTYYSELFNTRKACLEKRLIHTVEGGDSKKNLNSSLIRKEIDVKSIEKNKFIFYDKNDLIANKLVKSKNKNKSRANTTDRDHEKGVVFQNNTIENPFSFKGSLVKTKPVVCWSMESDNGCSGDDNVNMENNDDPYFIKKNLYIGRQNEIQTSKKKKSPLLDNFDPLDILLTGYNNNLTTTTTNTTNTSNNNDKPALSKYEYRSFIIKDPNYSTSSRDEHSRESSKSGNIHLERKLSMKNSSAKLLRYSPCSFKSMNRKTSKQDNELIEISLSYFSTEIIHSPNCLMNQFPEIPQNYPIFLE